MSRLAAPSYLKIILYLLNSVVEGFRLKHVIADNITNYIEWNEETKQSYLLHGIERRLR